jgi:hypothetical protein
VLLELERQDDDVFAWAKRHVTFMPLRNEIQASATEILTKFPQLVNTRRSRSVADPFVIALARVQGLTVVSADLRDFRPTVSEGIILKKQHYKRHRLSLQAQISEGGRVAQPKELDGSVGPIPLTGHDQVFHEPIRP